MPSGSLLDIALDHLSLGRAALTAALLTNTEGGVRSAEWEAAYRELDIAVDHLRRSGRSDILPIGLLNRAWLRYFAGARIGADSAQKDLDEAWEIAERGPM